MNHATAQRISTDPVLKLQMDYPDPKRRKKSDKAKEKFARNGGFSQKHVRLTEELQNKRTQTSSNNPNKKN